MRGLALAGGNVLPCRCHPWGLPGRAGGSGTSTGGLQRARASGRPASTAAGCEITPSIAVIVIAGGFAGWSSAGRRSWLKGNSGSAGSG